MGIEIERKFIVKNEEWMKSTHSSFYVTQGYLSTTPTVRVRLTGPLNDEYTQALITIKGKNNGISRSEFEYEIPVRDGIELLGMCDGVIHKVRSMVWVKDHMWSVDRFMTGRHKDLVLAEVELTCEDEYFNLPTWVGEDVSHDPQYYNSNMMKI